LEDLFGKRIKPACSYCEYAYPINGVLWMCSKKGISCADEPCRHYRYDPLMRVPLRPLELEQFNADDFSIELNP